MKESIVRKHEQVRVLVERDALRMCKDHPFIVTLYSSFNDSWRVFLLMEYVPGGSLGSLIARGCIAEEPARFYWYGLKVGGCTCCICPVGHSLV